MTILIKAMELPYKITGLNYANIGPSIGNMGKLLPYVATGAMAAICIDAFVERYLFEKDGVLTQNFGMGQPNSAQIQKERDNIKLVNSCKKMIFKACLIVGAAFSYSLVNRIFPVPSACCDKIINVVATTLLTGALTGYLFFTEAPLAKIGAAVSAGVAIPSALLTIGGLIAKFPNGTTGAALALGASVPLIAAIANKYL